jgi:hypothetical protein
MKTRLLLLAISALAFGSCTTMYKSGQTPDDVYYSPGIEETGYANNDQNQNDDDGYVDVNDRYLRMKSSSQRWSAFDDDFAYWNNPGWNSQVMFNSFYSPWGWSTGWGVGVGYGSPWGWSMNVGWGTGWYYPWGWNSWYNPFCPGYYGNPVVIVKPVPYNPRANGPRTYNLNTYNPKTGKPIYTNPKLPGRSYAYTPSTGSSRVRVFNNVNSNATGTGSKYIYYDGNRNSGGATRPRGGYNNSDYRSPSRSSNPSRTFEPRSNNSGSGSSGIRSSGGSSGGSAPTRSFGRGGGN